jgi:hypothetical protein
VARANGAQPADELGPAHARHFVIGDDQIRHAAVAFRERASRIFERRNFDVIGDR